MQFLTDGKNGGAENRSDLSKATKLSMMVIPGSPGVLTLPSCAWAEHVDSSIDDVTRKVQR